MHLIPRAGGQVLYINMTKTIFNHLQSKYIYIYRNHCQLLYYTTGFKAKKWAWGKAAIGTPAIGTATGWPALGTTQMEAQIFVPPKGTHTASEQKVSKLPMSFMFPSILTLCFHATRTAQYHQDIKGLNRTWSTEPNRVVGLNLHSYVCFQFLFPFDISCHFGHIWAYSKQREFGNHLTYLPHDEL